MFSLSDLQRPGQGPRRKSLILNELCQQPITAKSVFRQAKNKKRFLIKSLDQFFTFCYLNNMTTTIQTSAEVEQAFRADLAALLAKYSNGRDRAEIEAEDHFSGYAECGEDVRITVSIPAIYQDGEPVRPYTEIDLGRFIR